MSKMAFLSGGVLKVGLLCGLFFIAAAVVVSLLYSLFLLLVAVFAARRRNKASAPAEPTDVSTQFLILIPAHDEEPVLAATLAVLGSLDYPLRPRVVVIADNCTDHTADVARGFAMVEVMERTDSDSRGKGHALNWALAQLLPKRDFDLVVIIDADTQMEPQFLRAMNSAYNECGRPSIFAAQGRYDVLNCEDSWRTAMMAGALSLVHFVRPLARERLGLSVGLKGNGMCMSAGLLAMQPWPGDSLTEDIEYALDLAEKRGERVRFVPGAVVRAQMPVSAGAAGSQRRRWERGRYALLRSRGARLLAWGLLLRDSLRLDLALDLFSPPLGETAATISLWGLLLIAGYFARVPHVGWFAAAWAASAAAFIGYVLGGFAISGAPRAAYRALVYAPAYVAWKMMLYAAGKRDEGWVRTERAPATPAERMEVANK